LLGLILLGLLIVLLGLLPRLAFHDRFWLLGWEFWHSRGWESGDWESGGFQFSLAFVALLGDTGGGWESGGWARSGREPFGLTFLQLLGGSNGGWGKGTGWGSGGELSLTLFTWLLSGGWAEGGRVGGGLELFGLAFGADHCGALFWGLGGLGEIGHSSFEEALHDISCALNDTLGSRGQLRFSRCESGGLARSGVESRKGNNSDERPAHV
jgi:hypothetical protein